MRIAVLAGGWGRRLGPLTERRPKPLMPLAGARILDYTLREAGLAQPREAIVVLDERVLPVPGLPSWVRVAPQPGPGLEAAIEAALEGAEGTVALSFTGYIARPPGMLRSTIEFYSQSGAPAVIAVAPVSTGFETFGFARLDVGGRVRSVTRRLEDWMAGRGYVFAGVLVGDARLLRARLRGEFHEALDSMAREGLLAAYIWQGGWAEIAYPWDVLEAHRIVLDPETTRIARGARVHPTAHVSPGVTIEEGAVVEPRAVIEGPAYIGRRAVVRAGAVIAPYTVIEEGADIGENSVLRHTHVYENATIAPGVIAERALIAEEARVRENTVLRAQPLEEVPPALRGLAERVPRGLLMGPIVPPGRSIRPCTVLTPMDPPP